MCNATLQRYFETINAGSFQETAALFADDGVLFPPFEDGIVGPSAIATYLETEAIGMQLEPRQAIEQLLEDGNTQYKVGGKVQTSLFGVNVAWLFIVNPANEIVSVRIKLLAALEELLTLKR